MNRKGPFVSVATLCERILHERDEGITLVRLLDTMNLDVPPETPDPIPSLQFQGNMFLGFKAGDYVGPMAVRVETRNPVDKQAKEPREWVVDFKGKEHGNNLIITINLQVTGAGLYWFDVFLGGELATSIPLRINIKRPQTDSKS